MIPVPGLIKVYLLSINALLKLLWTNQIALNSFLFELLLLKHILTVCLLKHVPLNGEYEKKEVSEGPAYFEDWIIATISANKLVI